MSKCSVTFCCRYRGLYQWEDGTVAYYARYARRAQPPLYGIIYRDKYIKMSHASDKAYGSPLCMRDTTSNAHTHKNSISQTRPVIPSVHANISVPFLYVICSYGYYTHKFLVCDARSACLQHGSPGRSGDSDKIVTALCKSVLATLFTCRNDMEQVPYSLVCDHNQDCLDSSDEDFCMHPSCSSSWQFECTNKQVSQLLVFNAQLTRTVTSK